MKIGSMNFMVKLSTQTFSVVEIETYPGGNNDITKVVESMPGISPSIGGFRNDIIIRGGAPNETVYYLDGIEIPNINHFSTQGSAGGPVGMINVSFIREVTLSSSAFGAEFDNPLSGVLSFQQREGDPNRFGGNFRFGASEAGLTLEGPLFRKNKTEPSKTTFLFSARRSYLQFLFEKYLKIPVEVEYASELRYRNPIISEKDLVIAISQSGETADTLAALELAKQKGAMLFGIVNAVGSSIARLTDAGSYIHAGPEIGVASTKAFTGQVSLLTMMALSLAHKRGTISNSYFRQLVSELANIPAKIQRVLEKDEQIRYIAAEMKDHTNALYLGRGYNFPVALEGALKLKEISYIHAEGYPAAEMKHGPIALIDENMPVIVITTNRSAYDKIVSNIQEVKARKGFVIAIVNEGDTVIRQMADHVIEIPDTEEPFTPLLSVIPLQLLSYHIALMRGCNVDQPRNLAKSVTVE